MKNKVWFVTGASKGLGLILVKNLIENGYRVAATSRKLKDIKQASDAGPEQFLPLQVDILDENSVEAAITATIKQFGNLDVIVNNAGYGQLGGLEELSDREARDNFDANVFGSLNVIRKALPHLRAQKSGHIFNIASIGGFNGGYPGFGVYAATKFAMHGFSEALVTEVKPFDINVTIVSPGYFRTSFLDGGSLRIPAAPIAAYELVRETEKAHQQDINGNQPGDPEKAAGVIISVAEMKQPPLHLFLGQDAYDSANHKIESVQRDLEAMASVATATSFAFAEKS